MRVCIVYDCLFPWTVGGAERWYRNLAERLADDGHEVTYLTRRQWAAADQPQIRGVHVIAVSRADELYGADGNRRAGPPLRFGLGVLRHLLRHRRSYDVVHTASFPYFSVLAAAAASPLCRYRLIIDWHEVWSLGYWRSYLGGAAGTVGYAVQRLCILIPHKAFCFSRLHRERLISEGIRSSPTLLEGEYAGPTETPVPVAADPVVVFVGRQIAEKRAPVVVQAIARARARGLALTAIIFGDGPEHELVEAEIVASGLSNVVTAPGFAPREEVERAMASALCLLHPSSREGYGLVVVEAAAHGTPVIVVAGPDNAATELVDPGRNGLIASSADPEVLADALIAIDQAGFDLRSRTAEWFAANVERLSLEHSLSLVAASYSGPPATSATRP